MKCWWLDDSQAGIKIPERSINNLRYADDTTLMAESEEELMRPLDEGERREWKSCVKTQYSKNKDHGIQSHHFIANRCGKNGNSRFYFLGFLSHCRQWLQPWNERCLLLGRKAMTNQDSLLKSRDINVLTKVHIVKTMVFPATYGYENWTINKAECWRTYAFEL